MKNYVTDKIRNICLLGHGHAGKTSLAEAMIYNSGSIDRLGNIADGNTTLDFDPEEIKRKFSVSTATIPIEWNSVKINIIDAPGYFDFEGGVFEALRAADCAVIVVSGKSGPSVGTENAFKYARERNLPIIVFVSKLDDEKCNYQDVVRQLRDSFGNSLAPFLVPIVENEKFYGVVDAINMKARKLEGGKIIDIDIPDGMDGELTPIREMIMESVAETDEALMEKYFNGEEFTNDEVQTALKEGVDNGSIIPIFCGSSTTGVGIHTLLNAIEKYAPSPSDMKPEKATNIKTNETVEVKADPAAPLAAIVFKTIADPYVGKLSMFKVVSGTMKPDTMVLNTKTDAQEKISHLYISKGKKQEEVKEITAGDIGAVTKLAKTNTGDTLCAVNNPVILAEIPYPKPVLSMAIVPCAKGDEEKINSGLVKLMEEDPTFKMELNTETHQNVISGLGDQHLDVLINKLKTKFGVSADLIDPIVPYRESIKSSIEAEGKHKKQSGGHGQYGHVKIIFEPGESEDLEFSDKVFGGAVPKNYFPAVEKGLRESISKGVLAGYPVVNLKATLIDGSYHPVDSSEMAFKLAASIAYKNGLPKANPVLLEPIGHLEAIMPESQMGDIIGDINKRRGRILGMNNIGGGLSEVIAEVPSSEMFKYATDLRAMTQGRGRFAFTFERYEEAPGNVAAKIIEESKHRLNNED